MTWHDNNSLIARVKRRWRELAGGGISVWVGVESFDGKISMSKFGGQLDFGGYGVVISLVFVAFGGAIIAYGLFKS
jgi:hypothetical protein